MLRHEFCDQKLYSEKLKCGRKRPIKDRKSIRHMLGPKAQERQEGKEKRLESCKGWNRTRESAGNVGHRAGRSEAAQ